MKELFERIPDYIEAEESCSLCQTRLTPDQGEICPVCQSRARYRTLAILLSVLRGTRILVNEERMLLTTNTSSIDNKLISTVYSNTSSRYHPNIDLRELNIFPDNTFGGFYGNLLFDCLEDHEAILADIFRTMAPGTIFLTHISPLRLSRDESPPKRIGEFSATKFKYWKSIYGDGCAPYVKVGSKWFVQAMRKANVCAKAVDFRDLCMRDTITWFIGMKPVPASEGMDAESNYKHYMEPEKKTDAILSSVLRTIPYSSESTPFFDVSFSLGSRNVNLKMEHVRIESNSSTRLCEAKAYDSDTMVLATDGTILYKSLDAGNTWNHLFRLHEGTLVHVFTLRDGSHLLDVHSPDRLLRIDVNGELLQEYKHRCYSWHGSQGIGESETGTVIYAEYPIKSNIYNLDSYPIGMWRLKPGALAWENVFDTIGGESGVTPVRHFHACTPTGMHPRQWIAFSGDSVSQSRMWISDDDGDTWQEHFVRDVRGKQIAETEKSHILRLTSFATAENGDMVWGTDDGLGKKTPALVKASRSDADFTYEIIDTVNSNLIRNIFKLSDAIYLTISESKYDIDFIDFHLLDIVQMEKAYFKLPNVLGKPSAITASIGTVLPQNGIHFFDASGVYSLKKGFVRMTSDIS